MTKTEILRGLEVLTFEELNEVAARLDELLRFHEIDLRKREEVILENSKGEPSISARDREHWEIVKGKLMEMLNG